MAGGPASHACRRGSGSTRGFNFFVLGGSFTRSGVDGTRGLGVGGLIRCAGRPREWSCGAVPPQERWHEGGWFLFFCCYFGGCSDVEEGNSFTRRVRHACRHRVTDSFTARGVFALGDSFTRSGGATREDWLFAVCGEYVLFGGGRRRRSGSARGRLREGRRGSGSTRGFNFFVLGGSFTRSGVDGTRGLGVGGLIRCAGRPREWSCGAVPPQERWHEGGWFLFFLWRLLRGEWSDTHASDGTRRFLVWGILSHARERRDED